MDTIDCVSTRCRWWIGAPLERTVWGMMKSCELPLLLYREEVELAARFLGWEEVSRGGMPSSGLVARGCSSTSLRRFHGQGSWRPYLGRYLGGFFSTLSVIPALYTSLVLRTQPTANQQFSCGRFIPPPPHCIPSRRILQHQLHLALYQMPFPNWIFNCNARDNFISTRIFRFLYFIFLEIYVVKCNFIRLVQVIPLVGR